MPRRKLRRTRGTRSSLSVENLENRELLTGDLMHHPMDVACDGRQFRPTAAVPLIDGNIDQLDGPQRPGDPVGMTADCDRALPDNAGATAAEYSSIDGTANNLDHSSWGSVGQTLERWSDAEYADGLP